MRSTEGYAQWFGCVRCGDGKWLFFGWASS